MYKNIEGYSDPTSGAAVSSVMKQYKQERKEKWRRESEIKNRPKVYIVSPYAGDIETNVTNAIKYCRYAIEKNRIPIAVHLMYPQILNDNSAGERELGLLFGQSFIPCCREVWVFGNKITEGMKAEINEAKRLNKTITYFEGA